MAIRRAFSTWKDWSTRQQGPLSLVGAIRGLQCWLGCPDCSCSCDTFVVSLGGLDKKAGRGEWDFIWLPIGRQPLKFQGPGSQCKTDVSAVQCSCHRFLLRKHLWGMLSLLQEDIHIMEGSTCWWCVDRANFVWNIEIGTQVHYYTLFLAKMSIGLCT